MTQEQNTKSTKAILTVLGSDRIGIIAGVTGVLAEHRINILDISQTTIQEIFTMIVVCDLAQSTVDFATLAEQLAAKGKEIGVEVRIQHEDVFRFMHRI